MKDLSICIDIDGTITEPYYWLKYVNEYFHVAIQPEDVTTYDINDVIGIGENEYYDFYLEYSEKLHRDAQIRVGAKEVINNLEKDHHVHIVTAREKSLENISKEWMVSHDIHMDSMWHLGSHNKVEKAKELHSDVFIEDRLENALQLSEENLQVLLIDCNYNRAKLPNNVARVYDWKEIDEWIHYYERWKESDIAL